MQRIPQATQRCSEHISMAAAAQDERDQQLSSMSALLDDDADTRNPADVVAGVRMQQLHKLQEQASFVTRTLGGTAALAERASKKVKRLDFLLERVTLTREIGEAMLQQRVNMRNISAAIEANDMAAATLCLQKYEEAKQLLSSKGSEQRGQSAHPDSNATLRSEGSDASVVVVDKDAVMESAKGEIAKLLRSQLTTAVSINDKLKIVKLTSMLRAIGFRQEACDTYLSWICEHTIAQLKQMVSRELRNMDDPTAAGMSHLTLVSNALDHVAAAMEQEQQHVLESFGPQGHLQFLHLLHSRCTQHCVPVVRDFLEKRKVLSLRQPSPSPSDAGKQRAAAAAPPPDPRRIDECLEDISHLVSCCGLYMTFMDSEMCKAQAACALANSSSHATSGSASSAAGQSTDGSSSPVAATPRRAAQYGAMTTTDNALFDVIQELLSIYIPLQSEYFEAAFHQAVKLQHQALTRQQSAHQIHRVGSSSAVPGGMTSSSSTTTLMGALTSLYGSAADSAGGGGDRDDDIDDAGLHSAADYSSRLSLVDDVFYFLRIAVHRACGTKSTSILSAVIISAVDVIQSKLLGEIAHSVQHHLKKNLASLSSPSSVVSSSLPGDGSHHHGHPHLHAAISPKGLQWICAAKQCQVYASKLSDELHGLVLMNFTQPDELVRFSEQRHDIDLAARAAGDRVRDWCTRVAASLAQSWMHRTADKFQMISYVVDEAQYSQFDLADPWAVAATVGWGQSLDFLDHCVSNEDVKDLILVELCGKVVRILEELIYSKKQYSAFGALQLDKDIRCVRKFFVDRTEKPVRELFGRLNAITSLLLVDRPQDARILFSQGDSAPQLLSADERKKVLSMRIEFDAGSIASATA